MEIKFNKGAPRGKEIQYPLTKASLDTMGACRLASPRVGRNHDIKIPDDFNILEATYEALGVRLDVINGVFPNSYLEKNYPFKDRFGSLSLTDLPKPLLNEGLSLQNLDGLAAVVHMDFPTQMPDAVLRWLLSTGENVKSWSPDYVNFLESIPQVSRLVANDIDVALNKAFEVKYYYGIARPEEVIQKVTGISGGGFTAYPTGSPTHPSFVAGHAAAAAAGVSCLINRFQNLSEPTLKVMIDTAYLWAQFRTFAFVHYNVDNIAGLILGGLEKYMDKSVVEKYKIQK